MLIRHIRTASIFVLTLCQVAWSQGPMAPVRWAVSSTPGLPLRAGQRITVDVAADIQDGWHVYAFHQLPNGPTPLRVSLDPNAVAESDGVVGSAVPEKKHDESFNLETELFTHSFVLHVPVRVSRRSPLGEELIPLSIRFQACDARTCAPPRTIHVAAIVLVTAKSN